MPKVQEKGGEGSDNSNEARGDLMDAIWSRNVE